VLTGRLRRARTHRCDESGTDGDDEDALLMPVDADGIEEHRRRFGDGFTPAQKATTVAVVVALVIAGVAFAKWSAEPSSRDAGATASRTPGTVATGGSSSQLAQTQAYDAALEQRIEDMVSRTLGPGHAAVTVAAQLDDSKRSSVTTKYAEVRPGTTVPITQNDAHETAAPAPSAFGATPTTVYEKSRTQQQNAVDKTVTNSLTPPGTLKRLSVSVLLDRAVVTPADVASIWRPSIVAAAGIDPKRDGAGALKVITVPFNKAAQRQAGAGTTSRLLDLARQLLMLLVLAVVLFVAWNMMKRAERTRARRGEPLDLLELETARSNGAGLDAATAAARLGDAPAIDTTPAAIEIEIADLIERQPDEVAQTLRSWLADRRA
jgi:flagellar M-ring protein FliF